jgi:hypothetical protein
MHLATFLLMFFKSNLLESLSTYIQDIQIVRLINSYITLPLYIYLILWILYALDEDRIKFTE